MEIIDLYNKAKKLRQEKHYDEVIDVFNNAISYCDQINNPVLKCKALRQQSYAYLLLEQIKRFLKITLRPMKLPKQSTILLK